jgi:hypothetical protein
MEHPTHEQHYRLQLYFLVLEAGAQHTYRPAELMHSNWLISSKRHKISPGRQLLLDPRPDLRAHLQALRPAAGSHMVQVAVCHHLRG